MPFGDATVRQRTNRRVCIDARIKEAAAHQNPYNGQAAGVRAVIVEQIRMLETLLVFPEDVCTDLAADTLVISRLRKDIDSENWVAQCAAALHEVQHRNKRHLAIAWEQKRLAIDSWAKEALQSSMTAAHKHLKSSEIPPHLPTDIPATATSDLTCTVLSSTDRRAEQWSQRWQRDKNQDEAIVGSMRDIRSAAVAEMCGMCFWRSLRGLHAAVAKSSALRGTVLSMALDETAAATATPTMT